MNDMSKSVLSGCIVGGFVWFFFGLVPALIMGVGVIIFAKWDE